jgi:hypothetical protein
MQRVGGVYDPNETSEALRGAKKRAVEPLEAGQPLHGIERALGKDRVVIQFVLARHGGIAPAARRRSLITLTAAEGICTPSQFRWRSSLFGILGGSSVGETKVAVLATRCATLFVHGR